MEEGEQGEEAVMLRVSVFDHSRHLSRCRSMLLIWMFLCVFVCVRVCVILCVCVCVCVILCVCHTLDIQFDWSSNNIAKDRKLNRGVLSGRVDEQGGVGA